ncbi:MAG TPA: phage baseplate assembly protein V [Ruminiclostridium sp.]|nr:phage baseplate assembly protein V [Ruminiclostridium sp.]
MSIFDYIDVRENNVSNLNSRIFGVTIGLVTNNKDPENLGRVKLKLPLRECMNETNWARVATLMAGKEKGSYFLPEVGDEVLVAFCEGDVSRPFVIGSLWNSKEGPPLKNEDGKNNIRKFKSRNGNELIFNDEEGKESIEIKTKAGQILKMEDSSEGKLTLTDKSGKNLLEIQGSGNQVSIKAGMKINIEAGSCKIAMDGTQNSISLESSMQMKLKAQMMDIEAAQMNIKSDGPLVLKGALVKIN